MECDLCCFRETLDEVLNQMLRIQNVPSGCRVQKKRALSPASSPRRSQVLSKKKNNPAPKYRAEKDRILASERRRSGFIFKCRFFQLPSIRVNQNHPNSKSSWRSIWGGRNVKIEHKAQCRYFCPTFATQPSFATPLVLTDAGGARQIVKRRWGKQPSDLHLDCFYIRISTRPWLLMRCRPLSEWAANRREILLSCSERCRGNPPKGFANRDVIIVRKTSFEWGETFFFFKTLRFILSAGCDFSRGQKIQCEKKNPNSIFIKYLSKCL